MATDDYLAHTKDISTHASLKPQEGGVDGLDAQANVLTQVHDALVQAVRLRLGQVWSMAYVGAYPDIGRRLPMPAVLVDLESIDRAVQESDGMLTLPCTFGFYCITDRSVPCAQWHVRDLALRVAAGLHQLFVVPAHGQVYVLGADPDNMRPELDAYAVWRVAAEVPIRIGRWPDTLGMPAAGDTPLPTQVYISLAEEGKNGAQDTILDGPHQVVPAILDEQAP